MVQKREFVAITIFLFAAFVAGFVAYILWRSIANGPTKPNIAPIIKIFKAKPTALVTDTPQNYSVLSWKVEKSTSVTVYETDNPNTPINGTGKNLVIVKPTQTTSYVLSATNAESGQTVVSDPLTISVVQGPLPQINYFQPNGPAYYPSIAEASASGMPMVWSVTEVTDGYIFSSQSINGSNTFSIPNFVAGSTGIQSSSFAVQPSQTSQELEQQILLELNVHNSVSDYWVGDVAYPPFQVGGNTPGPAYAVSFLYDNNGTTGPAYSPSDLPTSPATNVFPKVNISGISSTNNALIRFDYGCVCNSLQDKVDKYGNLTYIPSFPLKYTGPANISILGFSLESPPASVAIYNQGIEFLSYQVYLGSSATPVYTSTGWSTPDKPVSISQNCAWVDTQIGLGLGYILVQISGAPDTVTLTMNVEAPCAGCGNCLTNPITDANRTSCSSTCQMAVGGYRLDIPWSIQSLAEVCIFKDTGISFNFCISASLTLAVDNQINNSSDDFFSFELTSSN